MKLPKITEMVSVDKKVRFSFFRDGQLWYVAENGFEFPVPLTDVGTATFKAEDKSVFFMRWMRKHLEYLQQSLTEQGITQ